MGLLFVFVCVSYVSHSHVYVRECIGTCLEKCSLSCDRFSGEVGKKYVIDDYYYIDAVGNCSLGA